MPFFAGFHRLLFGRAQRCAQQQLLAQSQGFEQATLCQLGTACAPWVPTRLLQPAAHGAHSRRRLFPQALTFWAFLSQILSPGSSCRQTLRKVQGWYTARRLPRPASDTGAYCRARSRLSVGTLQSVRRHTADELQRRVSHDQLWCGRHVKVIDGTGVSMPDTPKNQRAFPQSSTQKKGCGFPTAKLVGCFCLHTGALLQWAEGTLHVHETKLFRKLFGFFAPEDVALTGIAASVPTWTSQPFAEKTSIRSCLCIRRGHTICAKENASGRMIDSSPGTVRSSRYGLIRDLK